MQSALVVENGEICIHSSLTERQDKMDIYCKLTDVIECQCGRNAQLREFMFVPWYILPDPGGIMSWAGYFYCLSCQTMDDVKAGTARPIAYRQGGDDNDQRIILSYPERDTVLQAVLEPMMAH